MSLSALPGITEAFVDNFRNFHVTVMNVISKSLYITFYKLISIFLYLYVEMVTVRFQSLPHCETNDPSQLQLSAYLSVPYSFKAFNPNSDTISVSTVKYVYVSFALIQTLAFC